MVVGPRQIGEKDASLNSFRNGNLQISPVHNSFWKYPNLWINQFEMPKWKCYLTIHLTSHLCRQKSQLNLHARQMVDQPFWDDPMLWPWNNRWKLPLKVVETWMSLFLFACLIGFTYGLVKFATVGPDSMLNMSFICVNQNSGFGRSSELI